MQMRDDLGITTKLENGKAYLEFALPEKIGRLLSTLQIEIWEGAEGERLVFHGEYSSEEADSMTALLLRPHLWDGVRDPYVYLVKAQGRFGTVEYGEKTGCTENEEESDPAEDITGAVEVYWQQELAIYDVRVVDKKGIFLNEKEFLPHEVCYRMLLQTGDAGIWEEQMKEDLERLARMGVNAIRLEGTGSGAERQNCYEVRAFYRLCRRCGFLTGDLWIRPENLPVYRGLPGEVAEALLSADGRTLTERYYYYQAKWSSEPVLYPALSILHRQENGLLSLTIYSNQKKVVLYVDGVLFLFQSAASGDPEFIFEDIPVEKLPLHLAAEAGNLSISLTVTKL
ncbi:MAG: hypothetical protein SO043_02410 [Lachnospiraceae bacterium]|uniref:Uncharacterized protein n=1 Tax=Waltera intestinalis TaxID=2606635 RepID=A0A6L5YJE7_9FIRM|nr:hypothetical protein [Waltera intestinalis]MCI6468345.1 hypothetical protein [Lachnospiraceae bacterium]MCI6516293.1 hypothetical protein [Lachnospiraceae bacterium]MDY3656895.1 hypothetical protein [Lachnospiraceae bacterium]MST58395.1 hypothetical protein [Waltera intestinalis]